MEDSRRPHQRLVSGLLVLLLSQSLSLFSDALNSVPRVFHNLLKLRKSQRRSKRQPSQLRRKKRRRRM